MLKIYLRVSGMEKLVLGQELYSWDYLLVMPGETEPAEGVYVGMATIDLPPKEICVAPVMAKLKAKEQEIQAEAHLAMKEVAERREKLLALTLEVV